MNNLRTQTIHEEKQYQQRKENPTALSNIALYKGKVTVGPIYSDSEMYWNDTQYTNNT